MKFNYKVSLLLFFMIAYGKAEGQNAIPASKQSICSDTVFFWFVPDKEMFWADYKDNAESIRAMSKVIEQYRSSIESGDVKVRVLGFCASSDSFKKNLSTAKNRSNQVKSYFIVHQGLKEKYFRTTNSTQRWEGKTDAITMAYLYKTGVQMKSLPEKSQSAEHSATITTDQKLPEQQASPSSPSSPETNVSTPDEESKTYPATEKESDTGHSFANLSTDHSPRWAIKTNVAYLAATVANLGIEYSFGKHYSIDLPIIYSPYTVARDYRLRFLAIQPEFRYWLQNPMKGHFFGVHLNIGAFNIAVDSYNRYQSPDGFYGVGLSYGYMLPFARHWAAEFTIGAGYVHTKYDVYYNIPNGALYKSDMPYNYWGLTKVGISLVYTFGK